MYTNLPHSHTCIFFIHAYFIQLLLLPQSDSTIDRWHSLLLLHPGSYSIWQLLVACKLLTTIHPPPLVSLLCFTHSYTHTSSPSYALPNTYTHTSSPSYALPITHTHTLSTHQCILPLLSSKAPSSPLTLNEKTHQCLLPSLTLHIKHSPLACPYSTSITLPAPPNTIPCHLLYTDQNDLFRLCVICVIFVAYVWYIGRVFLMMSHSNSVIHGTNLTNQLVRRVFLYTFGWPERSIHTRMISLPKTEQGHTIYIPYVYSYVVLTNPSYTQAGNRGYRIIQQSKRVMLRSA